MSDYRRLISYLYSYEGGVKGRNVGYARLETRQGQCRIYVNVKRIFPGANDIGVYLLTPESEIAVGKLFVRGGAGEFRVRVNADDVEGSGHPLEDCYGLTIHDTESAWQCCTTIWEDAVARAAEAVLADVTADNVHREEEAARLKREIARVAPLPAQEEPVCAEPESLPVSDEIERELEREEERQKDVAPWDEVGIPAPGSFAGPQSAEGEPVQSANREPEPARRGPLLPHLSPRAEKLPEPVGDEKILAEFDRIDQTEQALTRDRESAWQELQSRCARLQAFRYEHGCEILSIRPQDIGLLPRETWIYGNNSFLLHGYYNHRHLILARLGPAKEQGRPRYLLGVPGHYFGSEKAMAAMFGFPRFVLSIDQPQKDARFGYWYTDIRMQ